MGLVALGMLMTLPKSDTAPHLEALLSHSAWVKHLARAIASSRDLADEVEQEAWRLALERPPRHTRNLKAWWSRVVRNSVIQKRRSETRYQKRVDRLEHSIPHRADVDPSALSESMEDFGLLARYVNELPPQLGEAIFLRFFQDKSVPQIAVQLGVAQTTVKSRLRRGLEQLRGRFQSVHGENWRVRCLALALPPTSSLVSASLFQILIMNIQSKSALALAALAVVASTVFWMPESNPNMAVDHGEMAEAISANDAAATLEPKLDTLGRKPTMQLDDEPNSGLSGFGYPLPEGVTRDAWLQLTLINIDGKPIPNLKLDCLARPLYGFEKRYYYSDENGVIKIPCLSGEWEFDVTSDDFQDGSIVDFSKRVRLQPTEIAEFTLRHSDLIPISGSVIDADGEPLEGILVRYSGDDAKRNEEFRRFGSMPTDKDGKFDFVGIRGYYHLVASTSNNLSMRTYGNVGEDPLLGNITFQFPPIRTVTLSAIDVDGLPIQAKKVSFSLNNVPRDSAPLGLKYYSASIGALDPTGSIRIEAPKYMEWPVVLHSEEFGDLVAVIPPEVTEYQFSMDSGQSLIGQILDSSNKPIEGATVRAWAPEILPEEVHNRTKELPTTSSEWRVYSTDLEGKFVIQRLPESQNGYLSVEAEGKAYALIRDIRIPNAGDGLIVQLKDELTISGTLLDSEEKPVSDKWVEINGHSLLGSTSDWVNLPYLNGTYRSLTDKNGRFHFPGLEEGVWKIWVHRTMKLEEDAIATVEAGTTDLILHMGDGLDQFLNVEATVSDSRTGEMLTEIDVSLMQPFTKSSSYRGFVGIPTQTDLFPPQINIRAEEVVTSVLSIRASGYARSYTLIPGKAGFQKLDIQLEPVRNMNLSFLNESNQPLALAQVKVYALGSILVPTSSRFPRELIDGIPHPGKPTMENGSILLQVPRVGGVFEVVPNGQTNVIRIPFGPEVADDEGIPTIIVGGI